MQTCVTHVHICVNYGLMNLESLKRLTLDLLVITQTCLCNIKRFLKTVKMINFGLKKSIFFS